MNAKLEQDHVSTAGDAQHSVVQSKNMCSS